MIIYFKDGMPKCNKCKVTRDPSYFKSKYVRRSKLTTKCSICRNTNRRSDINPTTKKGKCRGVYQTWKSKRSCQNCGIKDSRLIEADHQKEFKKVHTCGDYAFWSNHGVEALKAELLKCRPLCKFCHRLKTQAERKKQKEPSKLAKREIINAEKLKRGACLTCKRKVRLKNAQAFDFDHINPETKRMRVSGMVYKDWDYFNAHCLNEIKKCRLLCSNCHHIKTFYS